MEYSAVSEVLDADYEAAGTCSEDLHVHAFNPVRSLDHPASRVFHPAMRHRPACACIQPSALLGSCCLLKCSAFWALLLLLRASRI